MFFSDQPQKPVAGIFKSRWSGGSFIVTVAATGAEVLRFDGSTGKVVLPAGSIPGAGLADSAITEAKIADNAVTANKILDGSITAGKIKENAVITDKIKDGNVSSSKIAADVIQVASVSLSNAEIKGLGTTAKELVAAPGEGKLIEFLGATLFHDYGTDILTGENNITIGLNDGTVAVAAVIGHADFPLKGADHVYSVKPSVAFNETAANTLNKNLALKASGNFEGNGIGDTVWTVNVSYRIHDFND